MSRRRSYVDHLEDLDAIQKDRLFTAGMSLEAFATDEKSLYATARARDRGRGDQAAAGAGQAPATGRTLVRDGRHP